MQKSFWRAAACACAAVPAVLSLAACGGDPAGDHSGEAGHDHQAESESAGHAEGESHEAHEAHIRLSDALAAGIAVEPAAMGAMPSVLSLPAEIRFDPDRVANISVPVQGVVQSVLATEGDHVEAGQALAVISSRELADLKAEFLAAVADEDLARSEAGRAERLFAVEAVSEAAFLTARADRERAQAARAAAETKLHALGLGHDIIDGLRQADDGAHSQFRLEAPIAGRVVERALTLGQTMEPEEGAAEPVFVIASTDVVWAYVTVFDADLDRVLEGAPLTLTADDGRVLATGTVGFVSPVVDAASRTGTARAAVENQDGALRPGQFVTALIRTGQDRRALRVRSDAIQTVDGGPAVFVPDEDGFASRAVTTGRQAEGFTEILSGLAPGERHVAEGAFTLRAELEKADFGDGHAH